MKVLYIGYYNEPSDWGILATNQILALSSAGVDVVCRPINLRDNTTPKEVKELENKPIEDCDVCIQHVFPDHLIGSKRFAKNIAYLSNNYVNISHSSWVEKLDMMDEVWVPSIIAKEFLPEKLRQKTKVVRYAFDTNLYRCQYQLPPMKEIAGKFKFYTSSSVNNEGLDWVIKCFHSEFHDVEDAVLILQLDGVKSDGSKEEAIVDEKIARIKKSLRLKKSPDMYKRDIIIPYIDNCSPAYKMPIHQLGMCYVSSSTQRSLSTNEFNAAAMGCNPIIFNKTDMAEYVNEDSYNHIIPSIFKVNIKDSPWNEVNNAKDYYIVPDELCVKQAMRLEYEKWKSDPLYVLNKKKRAFLHHDKFSIMNIGLQMKETIDVA